MTTNHHDSDSGTSSSSSSSNNHHHLGFANLAWQVHKFGGTSVASADCFLLVAAIVERQLGLDYYGHGPGGGASPSSAAAIAASTRMAVVVSAMGGKPKTTDLLLEAVAQAAERRDVSPVLDRIEQKHTQCLQALFGPRAPDTQLRLQRVIEQDLDNIRDILKTVSLMKWNAARISEVVSGYGELWSTQILAALLQLRYDTAHGSREHDDDDDDDDDDDGMVPRPTRHAFVYVDARRVITVDEEAIQNGGEVEWTQSQQKLQAVYDEACAAHPTDTHLHLVMTGYVASNTNGVATTLQRDGSDYSAAILGKLLQATAGITIWTDVDGVLTADPRRVPLCQVLAEVSYNEAMELAYFGAKVVHGKTMQPAITSRPQIPIYIRNTFRAHLPGTRIFTTSTTQDETAADRKVVCGFSSVENIALINVEGSGLIGVPGVARRLFGTLEQHKVNVILISQASSEHTVTFACAMTQAQVAKRVLEEEFAKELSLGRINSVDVQAPASIIAAVGDGMYHTTGVSGRFFSALGDAKINVLAVAQGCSERNISAVVRMEDSTRALRAVHAAFRLSHTSIRVAIVGMNELGDSLLKLLDSQRAFLKENFELDLQVVVILPSIEERKLIVLKNNQSDTDDSIDYAAFKTKKGDMAVTAKGGLQAVLTHLYREEATNHALFDCTNDEEAGRFHSFWLKAGIDVVTANNTGLSGPKSQRNEIRKAEKMLGKQSAVYMREVTVGGGLPVISTMRQLLNSGDKIRRIDGIFSTSLSYIMFRVSPPPHYTLTGTFDEELTQGRYFHGSDKLDEPCSFSQAVKEAISLGLMEEDPTKDLNNEYTSRMLMVVACELGLDNVWETETIQAASDDIVETVLHHDNGQSLNYQDLPPAVDEEIKARVDAARAKGNVLRHIASVDVKTKKVTIQLMEVPEHHVFACTPPSCEIVRFFTQRHKTYPLVVQGPSAGADSTASALVAELLNVMRGKVTPRSVALSRSGSYLALRNSGLLPSPQTSFSNLQISN